VDNLPFGNLNINTIGMQSKDIFKDIFISPKERRGFACNNTVATLPIYFYRIIGVENEEDYYNNLFNLDKQLSKIDLYRKIDSGLDMSINPNKIDSAARAFAVINEALISKPELIVENLSRFDVLLSTKNLIKDLIIKDKLTRVLRLFINHQKVINLSVIKNFCIKMAHWIEKYDLYKITKMDYNVHNPKLLFYGNIRRDEAYFLMFLSLIGFDVLYFNSFTDSEFCEIDKDSAFSNILEFNLKVPLKPFPLTEKLKRVETVAYQASREIESIINTEESRVYKPWQFENYHVKSNPLKTTYDELFILWKEEARFRTGFIIKEGTVYIPNIFAKINGTESNLNAYWTNIARLTERKENVILIEQIPFTKPNDRPASCYRDLIKTDGFVDKEKVFRSKEYKLSYLRTSIQHLIIDKANELIALDNVFLRERSLDFKLKILNTILNLDKNYYNLIQKFDYPFCMPKLIIYSNSESGFSEEDFIVLAFLYSVGFDIAVLTPAGYNNVENGINKDLFDIHNQEQLRFDLSLAKEAKTIYPQTGKKGFFSLWNK
jgi:hypothetical protein